MSVGYIGQAPNDGTFTNAAALTAYVTSKAANGDVAKVTGLGIFKLNKTSTLVVDNVTVIAAANGGNWEAFNTGQVLITSDTTNKIDVAQLPLNSITSPLIMNDAPVQWYQGTAVASANNLALTQTGNVFSVTGTTQINLITVTGWQAGSTITLIFAGIVTVKYNQTPSGANKAIYLVGHADYVTTANSTLVLTTDGTAWYQVGGVIV